MRLSKYVRHPRQPTFGARSNNSPPQRAGGAPQETVIALFLGDGCRGVEQAFLLAGLFFSPAFEDNAQDDNQGGDKDEEPIIDPARRQIRHEIIDAPAEKQADTQCPAVPHEGKDPQDGHKQKRPEQEKDQVGHVQEFVGYHLRYGLKHSLVRGCLLCSSYPDDLTNGRFVINMSAGRNEEIEREGGFLLVQGVIGRSKWEIEKMVYDESRDETENDKRQETAGQQKRHTEAD